MGKGSNYNGIPELSLEKLIEKINIFRKEAIYVAKEHNSAANTEAFYDVLQKYCYFHKEHIENSAIFLDIIIYLENRLNKILKSEQIELSHFTFWFNYNPRFFSYEQLGRIINEKELAYRFCREADNGGKIQSSYDIIDSKNKDDFNVYYFRRVIGEGSKIEDVSKDIISVQQILCNHKEIELIKVFRDSNELSWEIKKYGDDTLFSLKDVNLFNVNELFYYTLFLKKTFGLEINESETPLYLKQSPDEFEKEKAKYTPVFLYMCNLSAPFSSSDNYSGSIMFASDINIDPIIIAREINNIKSIVELITEIEAQYLNVRNKELVLQESVKSAISAIMSRNMSHNLGSHYLYYTKAHLDKVSSEFLNFGDETGKFAPDIRGAAKVLGYVQGRMDYLATVISQDKYPYGSVNFKTHIWDELTIDDFSSRHFGDPSERNKRTTNYLLSNLVMSENFTRPDVREGWFSPDRYLLFLNARYARTKDSNNEDVYEKFTGTLKNKKAEDTVKKDLSQLYLALPGGTMSCHAFFNVIENFIRNSAKYLQSDFKSVQRIEGDVISAVTILNFTIAIRRNPSDNNLLDFIIFDNKQNANRIVNEKNQITLYDNIVYHILGELRIIDDSGHIEKEAKGFKEMLFSALWMHAYNFGNKTFADIISEINDIDVRSEKDQEKKESLRRNKIKLIENYAFRVVQVIDNEKLSTLTVLNREELQNYTNKDLDKASLGIIVTIPEFKQEGSFCPILSNPEKTKQNLMKTYADIVTVPAEYEFYEPNKEFTGLFPRSYSGIADVSLNEKFKTLLRRRFAGFDDYCLDFDSGPMGPESTDLSHRVYFKRHLSSKDKGCLMNKYRNYAYADTISGGNFTITLEQLCKEGWNGSSFDEQSEFFALKVIESALTRITIIDERLYNSNALGHEDELSLKNIRVLNYNTFEDKLSDVLNGCHFVLYKGVQDFKTGKINKKKLDIIKRTLKSALEEAYCSVKHIPEITEEMQDISQSVDWLVDYVEKKLRDSIDSFIKDISGCQELAGDELKTQSYNNLIINYVETLSSSELEKSAALRKLIAPIVKEIRNKVVQEVNYFANGDMSCILQGNVFRDMKDDSLFLSIHLGLVEKILKNSEWINDEITRRLSLLNTSDSQKKKDLEIYDRLSDDRVAIFMEMLHDKFASTDTTGKRKELFISIHSGRGNFSRELERSLKRYPFITLSALENAFNNCKYLLSQVFYNTIYLGKGVANE